MRKIEEILNKIDKILSESNIPDGSVSIKFNENFFKPEDFNGEDSKPFEVNKFSCTWWDWACGALVCCSWSSKKELPERSVPLSDAGIKKLIVIVRKNPELSAKIADELEKNPREFLNRYFRLSISQRNSIENTTDNELKIRAAKMVSALREQSFDNLQFYAGNEDDNEKGTDSITICRYRF